MNRPCVDLVVVGAGPCGLAAAWEAAVLGFRGMVLERGLVANALRFYPEQMRFYATAADMAIGGMRPKEEPDGRVTVPRAVAHFQRVAQILLWPVHVNTPVLQVVPDGGRFHVRFAGGSVSSRAIILATGQMDGPRRLGVPGEELDHISHFFDRADRYRGLRVCVIGGSYSALETTLYLAAAGVYTTLVHRRADLGARNRVELHKELRALIAAGRLRLMLEHEVVAFTPGGLTVRPVGLGGPPIWLPADRVFVQIGYVADPRLIREAGVEYTPDGVPVCDPATGATRVPGLCLIGAATNGETRGERRGIRGGIPQARRAVAYLAALLRSERPPCREECELVGTHGHAAGG